MKKFSLSSPIDNQSKLSLSTTSASLHQKNSDGIPFTIQPFVVDSTSNNKYTDKLMFATTENSTEVINWSDLIF